MYETSKVSINGSVLTVKGLNESSFMHSHNIYSGGCLSPVVFKHGWHKPDFTNKSVVENFWTGKKTVAVPLQYGLDFYTVRCRHCPMCTAAARHDWAERAVREHEASKFSVFGTLTFSEQWFARRWREENSYDVVSTFIDPPEFEERRREEELKWLLEEFTRWLKRLRWTGLAFRYMAVTEYGTKNGRPHIHILMHLQNGASYLKVRKALKGNFEHFPGCSCRKGENCRVGWCDIERVQTEGACHYVCKYISKMWESVDEYGVISAKSARSRVRASLKYGHQPPEPSADIPPSTVATTTSCRGSDLQKDGAATKSPPQEGYPTAARADGQGEGAGLTVTGLGGHADTRTGGAKLTPGERWRRVLRFSTEGRPSEIGAPVRPGARPEVPARVDPQGHY